MYLRIEFDIIEAENIFKNLLFASPEFDTFAILDSNNYTNDKYGKYEKIAAIGNIDKIGIEELDGKNSLRLNNFIDFYSKTWKFVYLNYSLKNYFEKLHSNNINNLFFYDIFIFIPKFIFIQTKEELILEYYKNINIEELNNLIKLIKAPSINVKQWQKQKINLKPRISKSEYVANINNIREHIKRGDIYEMNFCQEFYSYEPNFDAALTFNKLKQHSPAPFSVYFKEHKRHLISASPERYIQKTNNKIISQPIKGTARRSANKENDFKIREALKNNIKERAENIMIVDLVRNDLSRISNSTDILVEELCKIYSFPQVHQMISTITATIDKNTSFMEILKSTFPMGSMTGAPKIRAMELIEKYESSERGLFSGSVGYINPNNDFDFNVIIRSLLYNAENNYLSLSTGGAITYKSIAADEYAESLLKAQAFFEI